MLGHFTGTDAGLPTAGCSNEVLPLLEAVRLKPRPRRINVLAKMPERTKIPRYLVTAPRYCSPHCRNPTSYTLTPTPHTLTLHPKPYTLHPTSCTLSRPVFRRNISRPIKCV